jgi:hypothetical protein
MAALLSEDEIDRRCTMAALAAAALHLLTVAGAAYQIAARHPSAEHVFIYLGQFFFYWGPAVLLLLMRKFCVLVGIVAVPVVILFVLRLHHVVVFWHTGINSMAVQKGDALGWVEMLFSLAGGAVALAWLVILLILRLIDILRGWRKG